MPDRDAILCYHLREEMKREGENAVKRGSQMQCLIAVPDAQPVAGISRLSAGMHSAGWGEPDASIRSTAVSQRNACFKLVLNLMNACCDLLLSAQEEMPCSIVCQLNGNTQ